MRIIKNALAFLKLSIFITIHEYDLTESHFFEAKGKDIKFGPKKTRKTIGNPARLDRIANKAITLMTCNKTPGGDLPDLG